MSASGMRLGMRPGWVRRLSVAARPGHTSWHFCDIARWRIEVRCRWKSGHAADITAMTESETHLCHSTINFAVMHSGVFT
jgi:hypothetical protein